jgi:hypothetical protein
MMASGNSLATARMIKYSGHINDMSYTDTYDQNAAIKAAYLGGASKTISAQFTNGFSGFGFGYIPLSTLPVHILSFTAKENNKTVDLIWKTENEENLSYYKVMRSYDGINYDAIGTVTARGINGSTEEYHLNDPQPYAGKSFYQLLSFDKDQTFKKSKVAEVNIRSGIIYTVGPNPFSDIISIGQIKSHQQAMQVKLTDLYGRIILEKQIHNNSGSSVITIPEVVAGVYLLKITNKTETQVFKLIKQ